jgi:hypothetical protein
MCQEDADRSAAFQAKRLLIWRVASGAIFGAWLYRVEDGVEDAGVVTGQNVSAIGSCPGSRAARRAMRSRSWARLSSGPEAGRDSAP